MNYVYIASGPNLWTTGFYRPGGYWHPDRDYNDQEAAADRVAYLNGRGAVREVLDDALNSGDGSYRP